MHRRRRKFSPWKLPAVLFRWPCLKVSCISLESSPLGMCVFSWSVLWASLRQGRKTDEWVEFRESLPAVSYKGLTTFPWAGSLMLCGFVALPHNPVLVIEWDPLSPIQLYYRSADQRFKSPHLEVCSCPIKHSQQWQLLFIPVAKWRPGALFWWLREMRDFWIVSLFVSCRNI